MSQKFCGKENRNKQPESASESTKQTGALLAPPRPSQSQSGTTNPTYYQLGPQAQTHESKAIFPAAVLATEFSSLVNVKAHDPPNTTPLLQLS